MTALPLAFNALVDRAYVQGYRPSAFVTSDGLFHPVAQLGDAVAGLDLYVADLPAEIKSRLVDVADAVKPGNVEYLDFVMSRLYGEYPLRATVIEVRRRLWTACMVIVMLKHYDIELAR